MQATAKVFTSGNSQAVRLPKEFRVEASEMWIRKNEATGEIIFSPINEASLRQARLKHVFLQIRQEPADADFLRERRNDAPRNPFAKL
jgi:antitoxin VapB